MKTKQLFYLFVCFGFLISCGQITIPKNKNQQIHDASIKADICEDPDASIYCCFLNMPSSFTSVMNIAGDDEPGERMIIKGKVFKKDGTTPYENVLIYAYHTDDKGYYSKKGKETGVQKFHGHLHGWCKTDTGGNYEIHSIRPSRYPGNSAPAHIHSAVKLPDADEPFYINDFVFKDDSLVNDLYLSRTNEKGGSGVVDLKKNEEGIWTGERNLILD